MRRTSLHVSHKHSHGCHCTTGDIIVFQACTALTELNLGYCAKLTGKAKETYSPSSTPDSRRKQALNAHHPQSSCHGLSHHPCFVVWSCGVYASMPILRAECALIWGALDPGSGHHSP